MTTTAPLALLSLAVLLSAASSGWCQTASDALVVETPSGTFKVPKRYLTSQVSTTPNGLIRTTPAFAFQFEMPDGEPVSHDYGLEGLPEISDAETRCPVVGNDISFQASTKTYPAPPEEQLANIIYDSSPSGMEVSHRDDLIVLSPKISPSLGFTYYYSRFLSIPLAPDSTGLFRCFATTEPPRSAQRTAFRPHTRGQETGSIVRETQPGFPRS